MGETYITCREENGSINISEEVITGIVKTAVSEVDGVAGLAVTAGGELAELIGFKNSGRGIKVQFVDGKMIIDVIITVKYGCNVLGVAKTVQERLHDMVISTTGMEQAEVNVHISGIAFEK